MLNAIKTENLTRRFRRLEAVNGLNLAVPTGSIFAFIGQNGAGKTTTIKMLMNIISPSYGKATVLGKDSCRLSPAEFRQIGYVSENQELPDWMRIDELLAYCKPMYPTWDDAFCVKLLHQFDLPPKQKIKNLSRGMRMKTALLSSLAYRPQLLVMDEPFAGLDALVREELIKGILELSDLEGWTLFISSHDIDEVERLADRIGFIDQGKLHFSETVTSIQNRFRQIELIADDTISLPSNLPTHWLVPDHAAHTIRFVDSNYQEIETDKTIKSIFSQVRQININPMSLRSIFLTLARTYRVSESYKESL